MAPGPRLDDRHLEAWRALLTAHRRILDRLEHELRTDHGLSLSEYEVLMLLGQAEGNRCRMGELARHLLVTPGGVTRLADRLESAGLLCRRPCPTDRRSIELVLTPEGRRRLRAAGPDHLRGVARYFGVHLSDDEADSLTRLLGRVAAAATGSATVT
ncbi:MAG: MarR family winged helix-turn-helix transcriptional regulator [Acidimicrobiia bacterium]